MEVMELNIVSDDKFDLFELDSVHDCLYQGGRWGNQKYSSEDNAIYNLDSVLKERIDFFYISEDGLKQIKDKDNKKLIFSKDDDSLDISDNKTLDKVNIQYLDDGGNFTNKSFFEFFNNVRGDTIKEKIVDVHDNFFISNFKHPKTVTSFFDSSTSYQAISELGSDGHKHYNYLHEHFIDDENTNNDKFNEFWINIVEHITKNYFETEPKDIKDVKLIESIVD